MPQEDQREAEYPFTVAYARDWDGDEDIPLSVATALGLPTERLSPFSLDESGLDGEARWELYNPIKSLRPMNAVVSLPREPRNIRLLIMYGGVAFLPSSNSLSSPYIAVINHEALPKSASPDRMRVDIHRQNHFRAGESSSGDSLSFKRGPLVLNSPPGFLHVHPKLIPNESAESVAGFLLENIPELRFEQDRYRGIKLCSEIRDKLEELEQHLTGTLAGPITGSRHGIGGNNPPEPIAEDFRALLSGQVRDLPPSPELAVSAGLDAVDSAECALRNPKPNADDLAKQPGMLRTGAKLFSAGFVTTLGVNAASSLTENAAAIWVDIGNLCLKLADIIESIIKAI